MSNQGRGTTGRQNAESAALRVMKKALKADHVRRSCEGKIEHWNESEAEEVVARMKAEYPGEDYNSYKCTECGWWHVGHVPFWVKEANE